VNNIDLLHIKEIAIEADNFIRLLYRGQHSPYALLYEQVHAAIDLSIGRTRIEIPFIVFDNPTQNGSYEKFSDIHFTYDRTKDRTEMLNDLINSTKKEIEKYNDSEQAQG